jgi:hypothetical protein
MGHGGGGVTHDPVWSRYVKGERQRRLDRIAQQVERGELVIRQASVAEHEAWARERKEREQRGVAGAAASSTLSHSPAGARQQAADATGTDSSHSERSR